MPTYTFQFGTVASSGAGIAWALAGPPVSGGVSLTGASTPTAVLLATAPIAFTLPAGEIVYDIQFTITRHHNVPAAVGHTANDLHILVARGGAVIVGSTDMANPAVDWPLIAGAVTVGGGLLGVSDWVPADFGAGFGIGISATLVGTVAPPTTASIDDISCTLLTRYAGAGLGNPGIIPPYALGSPLIGG